MLKKTSVLTYVKTVLILILVLVLTVKKTTRNFMTEPTLVIVLITVGVANKINSAKLVGELI